MSRKRIDFMVYRWTKPVGALLFAATVAAGFSGSAYSAPSTSMGKVDTPKPIDLKDLFTVLASELAKELTKAVGDEKSMSSQQSQDAMLSDMMAAGYFVKARYLSPGKRDPFTPLTPVRLDEKVASLGREVSGEKVPRKPQELKKFGDELKTLKNVPYEIYRKIANINPALYANLERHARMFQEKKELLKMSYQDYGNVVGNYRRLIDEANKLEKEIPKTALQTDLASLMFTGVIWSGSDGAALIETSDNLGHIARKGTLIGKSFGVVDSIADQKIVIMERERDYLGSLSSNFKKLDIFKISSKDTTKEKEEKS